MKSARWVPLSTVLLPVFLLPSCDMARSEVSGGESSDDLVSTSSLMLQEEPAVAASVARRFAEAADGHRTGDATFFVAQLSYPYEMLGPFPSRAAADSVRALRGEDDFVSEGPFLAEPDFGRTSHAVVVPCKKPTSRWCDTLAPDVFHPDSIGQMSLSVILVSGDTVVYSFSPDTVEAFFFTVSAIDRFVIPYYTRLFGQAWVDEFRDSLEAAIVREIP